MLRLVDLFLVKWLTVLERYVVRPMGPTLLFSLSDMMIHEINSNAISNNTFIEQFHVFFYKALYNTIIRDIEN